MRRTLNGKTRKELIEEYSQKDVTWLAEKLADVRLDFGMLKKKLQDNQFFFYSKTRLDEIVQQQNENLKTVLMENGIIPTRLRIEYVVEDCDNCPCYPNEDDDFESDCYYVRLDDRCPVKSMILTTSFYSYTIDDGILEGISNTLESEHYSLIKVVDERTGDIIWKRD